LEWGRERNKTHVGEIGQDNARGDDKAREKKETGSLKEQDQEKKG